MKSCLLNNSLDQLTNDYGDWLSKFRNCAPNTVKLRKQYLLIFFTLIELKNSNELNTLSHKKIESLFVSYCNNRGKANRRSMQATLRTFFKYCFFNNLTALDFSVSIPTIRTYKLATIPRGISEVDAKRVFTLINRCTDMGRRDYAILQLLYHYGVRAEQVRALRLQDIDWHQNTILFNALKHGKPVLMPLLNETGSALIDYLKHSRPQANYPEIFLRHRLPFKPLGSHGTISETVGRYMRRADIKLNSRGAHAFRHGFAQRMLDQGSSLKSIADCLGHTSIQTTTIYTKVDFVALSLVPLELPTAEVL